jgi:ribonuclease HI
VGVLLLTPDGEQFKYMVHLDFKATNNMVQYEALLFRLSTTLSLGARQLLMKGDSQLIIKQVRGECCCNDPQLAAYLLHTQELEKTSRSWTFTTSLAWKMQSQMTCQPRPPPRLQSLMECLKDDCGNLQLGQPT